jgi:peptidoglycan/LPS O-acetylase OafA/YrhL
MIEATRKREARVDLARTIAILSVVLVHSIGVGYGRFGVQLFFIISGYLLYDSLGSSGIKKFLIYRFWRLFPLALVFLIIFYARSFNLKDLVLNFGLIGNIWWSNNQYPGGWSISNEWIFSLFLPLVVYMKRINFYLLMSLIFIIQIIISYFESSFGGYLFSSFLQDGYRLSIWLNMQNPIGNFVAFALGMIIRSRKCDIKNKHLILLLPVVYFCVYFDREIDHFLPLQIMSMLIIFITCLNTPIEKFKKLGTSVHTIGKITYGTFFSHFIILDYMSREIPIEILALKENMFGGLLFFFTALILSLMAGYLTFILIEKPCIKLGRYLVT